MNTQLHDLARPLRVAVIEVEEGCALPNRFDVETQAGYALVPAHRSPSGYRWHELFVDEAAGTLAFHATAHALVSCIAQAAEERSLPGFRLVDGTMYRQPLLKPRDDPAGNEPSLLMA